MNPATLDAFRAHAVTDYPREACGLVVVAKGRERYRPCRNLATTPSEHFVLAAEDYADAEEAGEIVAVMHSHPDAPARASEGDRVACEASGLPWWIVSVTPDADGVPSAGELSCIEPSGYEAPLVGRPFHHGVLDCWTLCRDWYAREWGLALPDPLRHDNWWDDGRSDLYTENLAAAGFVPIDAKDIQRGDLILMQIRSRNLVPNHAGIYLGDGLMLHHMYGRLSSRDVYGGYWVENTRVVARLAFHQPSA